MHFVLITIGSHGDVHPFIGIGQALQSRGHRISFITNAQFKPLAERAGLREFLALGTSEEFDRISNNPDLWHKRKGAKTIMAHVGESIELVFNALRSVVTTDSIVVASSLALAARIDSDSRGIRTATVHLAPSVFLSSVDPPVLPGVFMPRAIPLPIRRAMMKFGSRFIADRMIAPQINAFRARHKLSPIKDVLFQYWHSPHLVIGLFPEWFARPASDWPANTVVTDFPLYDEAEIEPPSEPLEAFLQDGSPPIAFTPGSAMRFGRTFFETAIKATRLIGRRAILLTRHEEQIPANLPNHALHIPYAPFSMLLPRCAAIAHHGGIGTTSQGLRAGVPQLIMPLCHDQPDNAHRLEKLGVGDSVSPAAFKPTRVARVLIRLLDDLQVAIRCREIAGRFAGHDSLSVTCDVLERFAGTKRTEKENA